MKKVLFLIISVGFITISGLSQVLTPEKLWQIPRISNPQTSPDGKNILLGVSKYALDENKGNRELYLLSEKGEPKKITDSPESEFNEKWRPDGKKIGYLSSKSGNVELWEMNPTGDGNIQITRFKKDISNFEYSPQGNYISFTMDVKMDDEIVDVYPDLPKANARIIDDLMYRHWKQWHDYKYSHVFYMKYSNGQVLGEPNDIMKNEAYDSPLNPFGGGEQIVWHPKEEGIVYSCKKTSGKEYAKSTNSDLYFYNLNSGKTINLTDGMMGYDTEPIFSSDGQKMIWSSMERDGYESDRGRLFMMDWPSKKNKELSVGLDFNVGHAHFNEDNTEILFLKGEKATYQVASLNLNSGKVDLWTKGQHNFKSIGHWNGGFYGLKQSMSYPTEIYSINPKKQEDKRFTFFTDVVMNDIKTGKVESRMVKTHDGEDMLVWVIFPPNFDPKKIYPTLLYCQGGPQSAVSQFFSYRWNFQLMAANDYIIVAPNRRGLPTFGTEWNEQISGDWGGKAQLDYLSAIDELAKEPFVDEKRLGAIGASYGGYSVYWLAGNHKKRFKTFISHCGLYNLESWYATTEELFFADWDLKGTPWDNPPSLSYQKFSPHSYAKNWDSPILVIHGEKDFRVPIGEGIQAFNTAQIQGIPSRFLYFPTEGHWVQSPQNGVLWHRVFFEWLDKWLKP